MKRTVLLVLGLMSVSVAASAEMAPDPQVRVRTGLIEGKASGEVKAFLGIPFAAPPVGELRWKPPAPPVAWDGVRSAKEFGARPMQPSIYGDMVFRDRGGSEDCLTLNVWTPAKGTHERRPVMVWIFGGGYLAGGSSEPRQDGTHLAEQGVVVVSMNYRLGVFGFMVHPELVQESPQHAAGNYGLMDQLAALQWVRDNIAQFGGDPGNVTIFGESAGSFSVSALMASPRAKGLFHRAIGESGGGVFSQTLGPAPLAPRLVQDQERLDKAIGHRSLAELRAMPAEELNNALFPKGAPQRFDMVVDGSFLTAALDELFAQKQQNDVPLLAGWNRDEAGERLGGKTPAADQLRKTAETEFGPAAAEFLRLYPADTEDGAARAGADFAGDRFIGFGTWAWLDAAVRQGTQPVYRYRFDRAPPADFYGKPRGAYHSAEILYVFGTFEAQPQVAWTPEDRAVSQAMQAYWVNFARTGNPNGPGQAEWPRYAASDWVVMHLDAPVSAKPDNARERYVFLARHWLK